MKRHETVGERRGTEIKNLAIAKQTKDAECVDLVHHLEGLTADVCQTREQRTALLSECKEVSRDHEQVVVQINAVRENIYEQDHMIVLRQKDVREQEADLARVNAEITTANEELNRVRTQCEREENRWEQARADLTASEDNLEQTKADGKTFMARLRDEELLQNDLNQKQAGLEVEVQNLFQSEEQLKGQSGHLEKLQAESKERQKHL